MDTIYFYIHIHISGEAHVLAEWKYAFLGEGGAFPGLTGVV